MDATSTSKVTFKEFYATEWIKLGYPYQKGAKMDLVKNPKYHFQTQTFLTNMMNAIAEPDYYLWQHVPSLIGFKHYKNEKYNVAPINTQNWETFFTGYNPANTKESILKGAFLSANKNSVNESYPKLSPFTMNQIIINNTTNLDTGRTLIWLNAANGTVGAGAGGGEVTITPYTISAELLNFTTDKKFEKILNPNNINNSIQIRSNWIQSEADAERLSNKVGVLLPTFNGTVELEMFGNPLIETGDILGMWYKLKGIGYDSSGNITNPQKYFVSSVKQNWDGSLKTQLVLKPL